MGRRHSHSLLLRCSALRCAAGSGRRERAGSGRVNGPAGGWNLFYFVLFLFRSFSRASACSVTGSLQLFGRGGKRADASSQSYSSPVEPTEKKDAEMQPSRESVPMARERRCIVCGTNRSRRSAIQSQFHLWPLDTPGRTEVHGPVAMTVDTILWAASSAKILSM